MGMKRRLLIAFAAVLLVLAGSVFALKPATVPPEIIQASVTQQPERLERAWSLPVAATYREGFAYQSNGSLCGPASLGNVFQSMRRGPVSEKDVLAGSGLCWTGFCILGLSLDELAGVALVHASKVTVLRDLTLEQFREEMRQTNDLARRYVVNFTREKIFGAGVGHHSPIGGYLEAEDMVFVLDVNEHFKPWLIETDRLFAAMDTVDSDGSKKRGLLRIE
jgi:hypothetical protein